MHARDWLVVGLLVGSAVAVRRAWSAEPPPAAPVILGHPHAAPRPRDEAPRLAWSDVAAPPKLVAPAIGDIAAALAISDVVDDGPSAEPSDDPRASSTAVSGKVRDVTSGDERAGVTVIATSPALDGSQTAITDEHGDYRITGLPPGEYVITFYYLDVTTERSGVVLAGGWTHHLPLVLDPDENPRSKITIDKPYLKNIPVPTRTFEAVLGAAAGSQEDGYGIEFSGSTVIENVYITD